MFIDQTTTIMTTYVALLRAINVGGTANLLMEDLRNLCSGLGLKNVRTYIQSGNILFESDLPESEITALLEEALKEKMQKPIPVKIRTIDEMKAVLAGNPFPEREPSKVGVAFHLKPVADDFLMNLNYSGPEEIVISNREIFIYFPAGMGNSKLKFPKSQDQGTIRNINTVKKLVELAEKA